MEGITKIYHPVDLIANNNVDFSVNTGEIHALVGENGAGKTTLVKVLYGLESLDNGQIFIHGRPCKIQNPLDANKQGIGMVHQHFQLFDDFTVAQNVVMGVEPLKQGFLFDNQRAERLVQDVIDYHHFSIDPSKKISELSVGQMQQVEILKVLYRKVELLILDEPTSVLTEQETQRLLKTLRKMVDQGKTIILISHKINVVKAISDRITVMRKGQVVAVKNTADVDKREISTLMVGKKVLFEVEKECIDCREVVWCMEDVSLIRKGQTHPLLDRVTLSVHSCEIVGITGVAGNGLTELEDVISGLRPVSSGKIFYNRDDITNLPVHQLREKGLAYVPSDRRERGSSLGSSVLENMVVTTHHDFLKKGGVFDRKNMESYSAALIRDYFISAKPVVPIGTLSGGNIQKVILARELSKVRDFVLFSEPTWGLDIGSSQFIYEKIFEMQRKGIAIILLSTNLDEILELADIIVVMYKGRIVAQKSRSPEITKELIGEYMLGLRDDFGPDEATKESIK